MSKANPFDQAKNLFTNTDGIDIENPFMVNKILSFNPHTFFLAHQLNEVIYKGTPELVNLMFGCVPKWNKAPFLKFARKKKQIEPKLVDKICSAYCVNKYHADQIIDLLRLQGEEPSKMFGLKKGE